MIVVPHLHALGWALPACWASCNMMWYTSAAVLYLMFNERWQLGCGWHLLVMMQALHVSCRGCVQWDHSVRLEIQLAQATASVYMVWV